MPGYCATVAAGGVSGLHRSLMTTVCSCQHRPSPGLKAHLASRSDTLSTLLWLYATISANMNAHAPMATSAPRVFARGLSMMLGGALGPAADGPKSCCWREGCAAVRAESLRASGVVGSGALAEKRLLWAAEYAMVVGGRMEIR